MHGRRSAQEGDDDHHRQQKSPIPCKHLAIATGCKYLVKDGRRISVGDCALFQAGKRLPYVGIICKIVDQEGSIGLVVNWLYRSADIELATLAAAPNELFYSFHQDSISLVSLLHPCKVAFLRKGVELPSGVRSFVCRRLYDVANKRLWWLTDRDYTDEHQEEVDKLLDRTELEMQATVQSGVSSPRALSGNASCQQTKHSSDNAPNSTLLTAKNKRRERADQNPEPSKRERCTKSEDYELLVKANRCMKVDDIGAIVEKDGGLLTLAGVDKLVALMQQERNDCQKKAADVAFCRVTLAAVIAATEKEDCLNRFVQLGGLPILDDWLQDAHKGKFGDGDSPKEAEKILEDLLLVLLRALDKLPVDLDALKTCIVGKSVNNLRSHKNYEIQKKARKLVDIWKKRVDAEMKQSDASHGVAWPSKQSQGDLPSPCLGKNGVPSDVSHKTSGTFAANAKAISNCSTSSAEATTKVMVVTPVAGKVSNLSPNNSPGTKDSLPKASNSGIPAEFSNVSAKEERSSCSSQSQNYGPSWSSAPLKGVMNISWKEDLKNASAHLRNPKASGLVDVSGTKTLVWSRNTGANEKQANVGTILEKGMLEGEVTTNQRLIVRLPIPGRSPARSESSGSMAGSPVRNRGSSPIVQDRHPTVIATEIIDSKSKLHSVQTEACIEVVSEPSSTSGKHKIVEGEQPGLSEDKDKSDMAVDQAGQAAGNCSNNFDPYVQNGKFVVDNSCISTVSAQKSSPEASSEADSSWKGDSTIVSPDVNENVSPAVGTTNVDNVAMSILATIAASQNIASIESNGIAASAQIGADPEHGGFSTLTSSSSPGSRDGARKGLKSPADNPQAVLVPLHSGKSTSDNIDASQKDGDKFMDQESCKGDKTTSNLQGSLKNAVASRMSTQCSSGENTEKAYAEFNNPPVCRENAEGLVPLDDSQKELSMLREDLAGLSGRVPQETPSEGKETNFGYAEAGDLDVSGKVAKECMQEMEKSAERASGDSSFPDMQDLKAKSSGDSNKKPWLFEDTGLDTPFDTDRENSKNAEHANDLPQKLVADSNGSKRKHEEVNVGSSLDSFPGNEGREFLGVSHTDSKALEASPPCSNQNLITNAGKITGINMFSAGEGSPSIIAQNDSKLSARSPGAEDYGSPEQALGKVTRKDVAERPIFDLNEGLDDFIEADSPPAVATFSSAIFTTTVPSMTSNGLTAPIAVIASTNGAFVPPASPLCFKKELGWKGSAATSAFRPAEPRRTLETPLTSVASPPRDSHVAAVKQTRPHLDIDLNVVDDQSLEDAGLASSKQEGETLASTEGGSSCYTAPRPDLDLNRAGDSGDGVPDIRALAGNGCSLESVQGTSSASGHTLRDFDLNDGPSPSFDEAGHGEPMHRHVPARSTGLHMMPGGSGFRMNWDMQNVAPWFPPGNSYSALAIPAYAGSSSDTAYPPHSFLNAARCVTPTPFNNELYRAGAAVSSTAAAFPTVAAGAYPYSAFPFGANFPLASASFAANSAAFADAASVPTFPLVSSHMASPRAAAPTFIRPPFLMSLPETASFDNNSVWGRLDLDLNTGPEPVDMEAAAARHPIMVTSQSSIEDQMRAFRQVGASGAALKRKELEGGLEVYRSAKHAWR